MGELRSKDAEANEVAELHAEERLTVLSRVRQNRIITISLFFFFFSFWIFFLSFFCGPVLVIEAHES